MPWRPAATCCTAWFPVNAPSARTGGLPLMSCHKRSAPARAKLCSMCMVPRRRTTSSAEYARRTPFQRGSRSQEWEISSALRGFDIGVPSLGAELARGPAAPSRFVPTVIGRSRARLERRRPPRLANGRPGGPGVATRGRRLASVDEPELDVLRHLLEDRLQLGRAGRHVDLLVAGRDLAQEGVVDLGAQSDRVDDHARVLELLGVLDGERRRETADVVAQLAG